MLSSDKTHSSRCQGQLPLKDNLALEFTIPSELSLGANSEFGLLWPDKIMLR